MLVIFANEITVVKCIIFVPMEALKIDRTKLKSVANYAKDNNMTRQTAYNKIKSGELKSIEIDGVIFVYLG